MSQDKKGIVRPRVTLLSLSNELLQTIADKLPSSSAAALAISNTELYSVLGPRNCLDTTKRYPTHSSPTITADTLPGVWNSWDYNSSYRNESRREFLLLLERDFPHYIYCRHCDILHPPWNKDSVLKSASPLLWYGRWCSKEKIPLRLFPSNPDMRYIEIQKALKDASMGSESDAYQQLQPLTGYRQAVPEKRQDMRHLWTSDIRIANDNLYLRSQHWFSARSCSPGWTLAPGSFLASSNAPSDFVPGNIICPHVNIASSSVGFGGKFVDFSTVGEGILSTVPSQTQRCCLCKTDYRLDIMSFSGGILCVVTTWKHMDVCEEPRSKDYLSNYVSEAGRYIETNGNPRATRQHCRHPMTHDSNSLGMPSLQEAFEQKIDFSVEECLTAESRKWLFNVSEPPQTSVVSASTAI
jgi:hypothetical protein